MVYAKTKDKEEWKKHVTSMCCVLIASLIMSVNIKSFVRAGNLIPGGFTGLSLLLQRSAFEFLGVSLPYSFINIALNAVPAFIGFKMIGKSVTISERYKRNFNSNSNRYVTNWKRGKN